MKTTLLVSSLFALVVYAQMRQAEIDALSPVRMTILTDDGDAYDGGILKRRDCTIQEAERRPVWKGVRVVVGVVCRSDLE